MSPWHRMCDAVLLYPPHGFIPCQQRFRSSALCLPDYADLLRLCLCHHLSLSFVFASMGEQTIIKFTFFSDVEHNWESGKFVSFWKLTRFSMRFLCLTSCLGWFAQCSLMRLLSKIDSVEPNRAPLLQCFWNAPQGAAGQACSVESGAKKRQAVLSKYLCFMRKI